jgi:TRAP-type C4-dicarboxylate transport system substrate-binding protein
VQKHVAITNHQYNPQSVIFSKKVWDTLSADERKLLDSAADEAAKYQREQSRALMATALDTLKKNGMAVTELSAAELTKFREKMKPVVAKHSATVGEATVAEVMARLDKLRK